MTSAARRHAASLSADAARAFGDVSGVPTLLLFDSSGKAAAAFYGAPPELHSRAEAKLAAVVPTPAAR